MKYFSKHLLSTYYMSGVELNWVLNKDTSQAPHVGLLEYLLLCHYWGNSKALFCLSTHLCTIFAPLLLHFPDFSLRYSDSWMFHVQSSGRPNMSTMSCQRPSNNNRNSSHFLSIWYIPGTVISALCACISFNPTKPLWRWLCCYPICQMKTLSHRTVSGWGRFWT